MIIGGVQKTSLLDYPDKISAIVFTQGCNFRCGYCHNPELINSKEQAWSVPAFLEFLKTRKGKLDAVVITGGEPCLQKDLPKFIKEIKKLGFLVKLDTNGNYPQVLNKVLPYVDYIAMDIKAPLEKYGKITNVKVNADDIKKSIDIIMNSEKNYEFRTTVVKSLLSEDDILKIGDLIFGAQCYYLQKFVPSKILDYKLLNEATYSDDELSFICAKLKLKINFVSYR